MASIKRNEPVLVAIIFIAIVVASLTSYFAAEGLGALFHSGTTTHVSQTTPIRVIEPLNLPH
jgi:hypothetical protein